MDGDTVDVVLTGSLSTLTGGSSESPVPSGAVEVGGVLAQDATVTDVTLPTASDPDTIVVSVSIRSSLAPLVASRFGCRTGRSRPGFAPVMTLIAFCSGKGSPGVSTLACVVGEASALDQAHRAGRVRSLRQ